MSRALVWLHLTVVVFAASSVEAQSRTWERTLTTSRVDGSQRFQLSIDDAENGWRGFTISCEGGQAYLRASIAQALWYRYSELPVVYRFEPGTVRREVWPMATNHLYLTDDRARRLVQDMARSRRLFVRIVNSELVYNVGGLTSHAADLRRHCGISLSARPAPAPSTESARDRGPNETLHVVQGGESLATILVSYGATLPESRALIDAIAPRFQPSDLRQGHRLRMVRAPAHNDRGRHAIVRLAVVMDRTVLATAVMTGAGRYAAVEMSLEALDEAADSATSRNHARPTPRDSARPAR
jgi:hypothetical protein